MEQEIIAKSVTLSIEEKKVRVSLPFTKDPAEFLFNRHRGKNNKFQACKVYKSQCKKPEQIKEGSERFMQNWGRGSS